MWVFYLISLPLTLGMVILTLKYFAGPEVPRYVFLTVGYTWFCSISIISLVPADIWTTIIGQFNGGISFFWSWSYWSTFLLTWLVVPLIQGYEDAGDFTVKERLKTSIHVNLVFYLIVGSIGLFGLILLIIMDKIGIRDILALAMAGSNTFGLVTGAFLLGFGLSEIPKSIWRNADWTTRQKVLSHKIAKMAVRLDDAHKELSNTIVVKCSDDMLINWSNKNRNMKTLLQEHLFSFFSGLLSVLPLPGICILVIPVVEFKSLLQFLIYNHNFHGFISLWSIDFLWYMLDKKFVRLPFALSLLYLEPCCASFAPFILHYISQKMIFAWKVNFLKCSMQFAYF